MHRSGGAVANKFSILMRIQKKTSFKTIIFRKKIIFFTDTHFTDVLIIIGIVPDSGPAPSRSGGQLVFTVSVAISQPQLGGGLWFLGVCLEKSAVVAGPFRCGSRPETAGDSR